MAQRGIGQHATTSPLIVVDVRGNKVRLGFEAPPEISIVREEVRKPGAAVEACARELAWI